MSRDPASKFDVFKDSASGGGECPDIRDSVSKGADMFKDPFKPQLPEASKPGSIDPPGGRSGGERGSRRERDPASKTDLTKDRLKEQPPEGDGSPEASKPGEEGSPRGRGPASKLDMFRDSTGDGGWCSDSGFRYFRGRFDLGTKRPANLIGGRLSLRGRGPSMRVSGSIISADGAYFGELI